MRSRWIGSNPFVEFLERQQDMKWLHKYWRFWISSKGISLLHCSKWILLNVDTSLSTFVWLSRDWRLPFMEHRIRGKSWRSSKSIHTLSNLSTIFKSWGSLKKYYYLCCSHYYEILEQRFELVMVLWSISLKNFVMRIIVLEIMEKDTYW